LDDINIILESLKKAGLRRAIIVDLTNDNIGMPVVRAIVPGLETFEVTKSVMGKRARQHFRALHRY
jgi:ribosomal protein S12 methylthiotransferase accessory factor